MRWLTDWLAAAGLGLAVGLVVMGWPPLAQGNPGARWASGAAEAPCGDRPPRLMAHAGPRGMP